MKKNILWFSNCELIKKSGSSTGTWLSALAHKLIQSQGICLTNISNAKLRKPQRKDCGAIRQWLVPYEKLDSTGLPSLATINYLKRVVDGIQPDLIHIWGTENYWGLLTARGFIKGSTILEMQGIIDACAKVYYGGLTLSQRMRCIGPLEIIRPGCSIFARKRQFEKWAAIEKEIIQAHNTISVQSRWVRNYVSNLNDKANFYDTGMMLRDEFYDASPWSLERRTNHSGHTIFFISSSATPYKGLHILLRAVSLLKKRSFNITLKVAGNIKRKGIRNSGYARWLDKESRRLGISGNIHWLGPISAKEIVGQLQTVSLAVIPSFIESYSLSLAEAMSLGVPIVASYAGAMPELARDQETALFFPPGDAVACAGRIEQILLNKELASQIGKSARMVGQERNDQFKVIKRQLEIYDSVLNHCNKNDIQ